MADLTTTRAAAAFPVYEGKGGGAVNAAWGTYAVAANPTAADLLNACKVPEGATVIGGYIQGDDLDTNATETLDIDAGWLANGDEVADPDGFGNFGVQTGDVSVHMPVAGLFLPLAGVLASAGPKTFNAETTIALTFIAAAATFAAGQVTVVVFYTTP